MTASLGSKVGLSGVSSPGDSFPLGLLAEGSRLTAELIRQIVASAGDAELRSTLGSQMIALGEYSAAAFGREEAVMAASAYPGLAAHRARHCMLRHGLGTLADRLLTDPWGFDSLRLRAFCDGWVNQHILKDDRAIANFVRACAKRRQGEATGPQAPDGVRDGGTGTMGWTRSEPLDWTALRVLIVDDNDNFRRLSRTVLEVAGVRRIAEANGAAQALAALERFTPDVILCDWRMDEMDGLSLVGELRTKRHPAPVVMMTGYADDAFRAQARAAGIARVVEKPLHPRELFTAVAEAVLGDETAPARAGMLYRL